MGKLGLDESKCKDQKRSVHSQVRENFNWYLH